MQGVVGKRDDRSEELSALAAQLHELEREAFTEEARRRYALVAEEYDARAERARDLERAEHKQA
jgi:hypothetical protein